MMHRELELKLSLDPGGMRSLEAHPVIRALARTRPSTRLLDTTYFDAPDWRLARAGMALRVRVSGDAKLLALKGDDGPFERFEYEARVEGDAPQLDALPPEARDRLDPALGGACLVPVFRSRFERRAWRVGDDDWEVEVALDRGTLEAGGRRAPIHEVELERVHGEPRWLWALALRILDDVPFRLLHRSKAARGYALAALAPDAPALPAPPVASSDRGDRPAPPKHRSDPAAAATRAPQGRPRDATDAAAWLRQGLRGELAVLTDPRFEGAGDGPRPDPRQVHQVRLALRRIRTLLRTFRPILDHAPGRTPAPTAERTPGRTTGRTAGRTAAGASRGDEVKGLASGLLDDLGPARDLHVFRTTILAPVLHALPANAELASLGREVEAGLREAETEAARALSGPDMTRLSLLLALGSEPPSGAEVGTSAPDARAFAAGALLRLDRRVRRRIRTSSRRAARDLAANAGHPATPGASLPHWPPEALHRLRLDVKRLGEAWAILGPLVLGGGSEASASGANGGAAAASSTKAWRRKSDRRTRKAAAASARELRALRRSLGRLNDIAVAGDLLESAPPEARGIVLGYHLRRRERLLERAGRDVNRWLKRKRVRRFLKTL